jgi:hypothetical protein
MQTQPIFSGLRVRDNNPTDTAEAITRHQIILKVVYQVSVHDMAEGLAELVRERYCSALFQAPSVHELIFPLSADPADLQWSAGTDDDSH